MPLRHLLSDDIFDGNEKTLIIVLVVVIVILLLTIGFVVIWICGKKRRSMISNLLLPPTLKNGNINQNF